MRSFTVLSTLAAISTTTTKVVSGQTVTVTEPSCRPLISGEDPNIVTLGEACATINDGTNEIEIKVSVTDGTGCILKETHVCNLPYVSPGDLDVATYTLTIPVEEAYEFVCGYDETSYMVAGHATVECTGTLFTAYFESELECPEVIPAGQGATTPPDSDCFTAFAYMQNQESCHPNRLDNPGENCATCFQQLTTPESEPYAAFFRWGWYNGAFSPVDANPFATGPYVLDLVASADECDTSVGTSVGSVTFDYPSGGSAASITYGVDSGLVLTEVHAYVGDTRLPIDGTEETVTPGLYPLQNSFDLSSDGTTDTVLNVGQRLSGPQFLIAHAVVCVAPATTTTTTTTPTTGNPVGPDGCPLESADQGIVDRCNFDGTSIVECRRLPEDDPCDYDNQCFANSAGWTNNQCGPKGAPNDGECPEAGGTPACLDFANFNLVQCPDTACVYPNEACARESGNTNICIPA